MKSNLIDGLLEFALMIEIVAFAALMTLAWGYSV
jgi:hypothetical protein